MRGKCIHLLTWFEMEYEVINKKTGKHIEGIVSYYLAKQAANLRAYKGCAHVDNVVGTPPLHI